MPCIRCQKESFHNICSHSYETPDFYLTILYLSSGILYLSFASLTVIEIALVPYRQIGLKNLLVLQKIRLQAIQRNLLLCICIKVVVFFFVMTLQSSSFHYYARKNGQLRKTLSHWISSLISLHMHNKLKEFSVLIYFCSTVHNSWRMVFGWMQNENLLSSCYSKIIRKKEYGN